MGTDDGKLLLMTKSWLMNMQRNIMYVHMPLQSPKAEIIFSHTILHSKMQWLMNMQRNIIYVHKPSHSPKEEIGFFNKLNHFSPKAEEYYGISDTARPSEAEARVSDTSGTSSSQL